MPLEVRDLWAGEEDVLACARRRLLLLDLQFQHIRWVLDDLRDVGPVARTHFTQDTLEDEDHPAGEPEPL